MRNAPYAYEENGVTLCAIEKRGAEGRTAYRKTHLVPIYHPIWLVRFSNGTVGLNYHRWSVCAGARECAENQRPPSTS